MTSLAMAMNGYGYTLPGGVIINPGTLNAYLIKYSLYWCDAGDCNNMNLQTPEALTGSLKLIGELPPASFASICSNLAQNLTVNLAHVRNRHHFVLLTGCDTTSESFIVQDPNYPITLYPYANVSDIISYAILPKPQPTYPSPTYPLYKQCDPRWGADVMETTTVCQVGCLMSSVAMSLAGKGILIGANVSNPGILNQWLRNNGGYDSSNDLEEDVVPNINTAEIAWPADGMHTTNDLSIEQVRAYLLRGRTMIANVMHGGHFVLMVGFDLSNPDAILVNDPGFNVTAYSYASDVVGWRIFDEQPIE